MKKLFLLLCFCPFLSGQTIIDVYNFSLLAVKTPILLGQVTGSDGTTCKLYKQPTTTIYLNFSCFSSDGKQVMSPVPIQTTSSVSGNVTLEMNTILLMAGVNPTSSPVGFGSVGTAPAKGIVYQLVADGNSATLVQGTAVWP